VCVAAIATKECVLPLLQQRSVCCRCCSKGVCVAAIPTGAVDLDDQSPTDEADFATQSLAEALVAVEKKIKAKGKGKGGV
jgi:hypothetical protein